MCTYRSTSVCLFVLYIHLSVCLPVCMTNLRHHLPQKSVCNHSKRYSCTLCFSWPVYHVFCSTSCLMLRNVLGSVWRTAENATWSHVHRQSHVFLDFSQYIRLKNKKTEVKINILTEPKQTLVSKKIKLSSRGHKDNAIQCCIHPWTQHSWWGYKSCGWKNRTCFILSVWMPFLDSLLSSSLSLWCMFAWHIYC